MTRETYLKAVDTLLDAYNEEKLFHGKCSACAVGNLLGGHEDWKYDFCTSDDGVNHIDGGRSILSPIMFNLYQSMNAEIYETYGFTKEELARIEFAFESSITHNYDKLGRQMVWYMHNLIDNDPANLKLGQFIGLTAVMKVMATMIDDEEHYSPVKEQERLEQIATTKFNVEV